MAPICGMCGFALTKIKSGVVVGEMRNGDKKPYKLWFADRFECETEGCDFKRMLVTGFIIADFAPSPFAEHHDRDFEATLEMWPPDVFWHERKGQ